jgi:MOSC domain-containing protein YiiM
VEELHLDTKDIEALALQRGFGHVDMGVYAKVLTAGEITVGDRIVVPDP